MNKLQESSQMLSEGRFGKPTAEHSVPVSADKVNSADEFLLKMFDEVKTYFDSYDTSAIPQLNIALRYFAYNTEDEGLPELINMVAGISSTVELISELKTHFDIIELNRVSAYTDQNSIFFQPQTVPAK